MPGPGEYLADMTEGITRVEDLPKAKVIIRSRNYIRMQMPLLRQKSLSSAARRTSPTRPG
jgi:hypothetical protein